MKTTSAGMGKEQVKRERSYEVSVMRGIRKHIYVLPSGRKLKVVVDDERELSAELFALQPYKAT
jgi:hypothetical protein